MSHEPPPGLDEFERHIRADEGPAVVIAERDLIRALLDWARGMERELELAGGFW